MSRWIGHGVIGICPRTFRSRRVTTGTLHFFFFTVTLLYNVRFHYAPVAFPADRHRAVLMVYNYTGPGSRWNWRFRGHISRCGTSFLSVFEVPEKSIYRFFFFFLIISYVTAITVTENDLSLQFWTCLPPTALNAIITHISSSGTAAGIISDPCTRPGIYRRSFWVDNTTVNHNAAFSIRRSCGPKTVFRIRLDASHACMYDRRWIYEDRPSHLLFTFIKKHISHAWQRKRKRDAKKGPR